MKIGLRDLKNAVSILKPMVNFNHDVTDYRYLNIKSDGDTVYFIAQNIDIIGTSYLKHFSDLEDWECWVEAKQFFSLISSFDGDYVEISRSPKRLNIKCGKSRYSLGLYDPDAFIEKFEIPDEGIRVSTGDFSIRYNAVSHCLSKDDGLFELQHVFISSGQMVACDSLRGAVVKLNYDGSPVTIHNHVCRCLTNIKSDSIIINPSGYILHKNGYFRVNLDNQYPTEDIKPFIDDFEQGIEEKVRFNSSDIEEKIGRLLMFADKDTNSIKVSINDGVSLSVGDCIEQVDCYDSSFDDFEITLDGKAFYHAVSKYPSDVTWYTLGNIQYLDDGDILQFFTGYTD